MMCAVGLSVFCWGLAIGANGDMVLSQIWSTGVVNSMTYRFVPLTLLPFNRYRSGSYSSRMIKMRHEGWLIGSQSYIVIQNESSVFEKQFNWHPRCHPRFGYGSTKLTGLYTIIDPEADDRLCSAGLLYSGEKIVYASGQSVYLWILEDDSIALVNANMKKNEFNPNYSPLILHRLMDGFLEPGIPIFVQYGNPPYGSLVSLAGRDSGEPNVPNQLPSQNDGIAASFFANFFLWGEFLEPVRYGFQHIRPEIAYNRNRSMLYMSHSQWAPHYSTAATVWEMLYNRPQEKTLVKAGGWGKKLIVGKCCDGTTAKATLQSNYGNYLTTTIDFQGDAAAWCTPVTAAKKGPRRCKEKPKIDVIDLLQYNANVATNMFPPKDIGKDENLWWYRAYTALALANMLPLRDGLVKWLKEDSAYDPAVLKSTTQDCELCLNNIDNQKHYLIGNVRRLLWVNEDKHDIVFDKTDEEKFYRYLTMTDRLIGILASLGTDDIGKEYISGKLRNLTKMDDIPLKYTCDKNDCAELALDVAHSLHNLAVYLKKLPPSSTAGIGAVIHSNPALVPAKPNHYADWKDIVECGSAIADDCTKEPYATFQTRAKQRPTMLYVGANDGHLYAFNTDKAESSLIDKTVFMYVPEGVIPYLSWLAQPIDFLHPQRYFVDGSPTVQDAFFDSQWHTVLAGGLRAGGQSVYALDITDPENFTKENVLWDFTDFDDPDVGYVYARPAIVKMNNGNWAVVFGNGYNNHVSDPVRTDCDGCSDPVGSGNGALFIVPLHNKTRFKKIDTGVAGGLGGTAPIDLNNDGRVDIIYAGDLNGKMWKFYVNSANDWELGNGGKPVFQGLQHQTILARPAVSAHPENKPGVVLYFGTGRRITDADGNLNDHAVYGVWDKCGMVKDCSFPTIDQATLVPVTDELSADVDWEKNKGWRRDLDENQAVLVPPVLRIGRLFIRTEPQRYYRNMLGDYKVMVFNAATGGPLDGLPIKVSKPNDTLRKAKDAFKGEANARKGNNKWWFLPATVPTPGEQEMVIYEKGEDGTFVVAGDTIFTLNPFHQELGGRSWQSWRRTGAGICR